ncbi:uncharacterized protein LOC144745770 [Ciona intestinalis]
MFEVYATIGGELAGPGSTVVVGYTEPVPPENPVGYSTSSSSARVTFLPSSGNVQLYNITLFYENQNNRLIYTYIAYLISAFANKTSRIVTTNFTLPAAEPPRKLRVINNQDGSVNISWDAVSSAEWYRVWVYDPNGNLVSLHNETINHLKLTELEVGTKYTLYFASVSNNVESTFRSQFNYTKGCTLSKYTFWYNESSIRVSIIPRTAIVFHNISLFHLVGVDQTLIDHRSISEAGTNNIIFDSEDVKPGNEYKLRVVDDCGVSSISWEYPFRLPPINRPSPVRINAIRDTTAVVSSFLANVETIIFITDDYTGNETTILNAQPNHQLRNLVPNRSYQVSVASVIKGVMSERSLPISFRTVPGVSRPPTNMITVGTEPTKATISWQTVASAEMYRAELFEQSSNNQISVLTPVTPRAQFTNLVPGGKYYVLLYSIQNSVLSSSSVPVPFTTRKVFFLFKHLSFCLWHNLYFAACSSVGLRIIISLFRVRVIVDGNAFLKHTISISQMNNGNKTKLETKQLNPGSILNVEFTSPSIVPSGKYVVTVVADCETSNTTAQRSFTMPSTPTPRPVIVSNIGSSSAIISSHNISQASNILRVLDTVTGDTNVITNAQHIERLSGLVHDRTYNVSLVWVIRGVPGKASTPVTFHTEVTGLTVSPLNIIEVHETVAEINSGADTGISVNIQLEDIVTKIMKIYTNVPPILDIQNLIPGRLYNITRVVSINGVRSLAEPWVTFRTVPMKPDPVTIIPHPTYLRIQFAPVTGDVTEYQVRVESAGNQDIIQRQQAVSDTRFTVSNLRPSTSYTVYVTALSGTNLQKSSDAYVEATITPGERWKLISLFLYFYFTKIF